MATLKVRTRELGRSAGLKVTPSANMMAPCSDLLRNSRMSSGTGPGFGSMFMPRTLMNVRG